jgi:hypothetical protein
MIGMRDRIGRDDAEVRPPRELTVPHARR